MKHLFTAAAAVTVLALAFGTSGTAVAAETDPSVTWAVAPATIDGPDGRAWVEHELDPGETVTEYVAVRNLGDTDAEFRLTAADGYFTDTGRFNMLPSDQPSKQAGTWIDVQPTAIVPAGEQSIIPFQIHVPENATPGDHAAGLAASVGSTTTSAEGARVGVESRVGFRVLTRVNGELDPALAITTTSTDYTYSWNPLDRGFMTVTYTAQNTGNVQLRYSDSLNGESTQDRGELLPGESRTITLSRNAVWPTFLISSDLTLAPTAEGIDGELNPVTTSITTWAIPWPQIIVILGTILVALGLVGSRRRSKAKLHRLLDDAREAGRREAVS
ncbi:hypothetical protein [Promicromonospora sp. NPDC057488]|uniref:hypothetical protein n=1 Tax=Promicromonospora sp. NPDC057488 TaxID=3346147 RepID=UPI0036733339